jgi:hypothetical protein
MTPASQPRLNRAAFSVCGLREKDDREYWGTRTPEERMEALEMLRQSLYGYDPTATRLQRFFEAAPRPRR